MLIPCSAINCTIAEPVLKDHPIGYTNMVSQERWSLVTGSISLKCRTFWQEYLVFQDRSSLMAVVSQYRFHCTSMNKDIKKGVTVCFSRPFEPWRTIIYRTMKKRRGSSPGWRRCTRMWLCAYWGSAIPTPPVCLQTRPSTLTQTVKRHITLWER